MSANMSRQPYKVDTSAVSTFSTFEDADRADREFWWSKTPKARLAALEFMRQVLYGYDPDTARIQKVIKIVPIEKRRVSGGRRVRSRLSRLSPRHRGY